MIKRALILVVILFLSACQVKEDRLVDCPTFTLVHAGENSSVYLVYENGGRALYINVKSDGDWEVYDTFYGENFGGK